MKKLIILALLLTLQFSAFSQDGNFSHPWKGATVAFFGDSITDPGSVKENHDWTGFSDTHFWGYLQEWLGIKPLVYGVSGRKWERTISWRMSQSANGIRRLWKQPLPLWVSLRGSSGGWRRLR